MPERHPTVSGQLVDPRFGIEHTTLQVDHVNRKSLITIEPAAEGASRV